jgi:serine/threonine-protein kinase RsbW
VKEPGAAFPSLDLSVPGALEAVPGARRTCAKWLQGAGADARALEEFGLVFTEICNNAVEHGGATPKKPLRVRGSIVGGTLVLEVLEGGGERAEGLDLAASRAVTPPAPEDERGRGLFLIRAFVDELRIDRTRDGHLRIRLRKSIRGGAPRGGA